MIQKHPLLKSTAVLCAGMVSRIIGFFYRIFLSKTIGAEGIGIYLLLFPIQTLLFPLTSSGIQTAISRFVSARLASNDKKGARRHPSLRYDALCPVFRDCFFFLYQNANFIAVSLLHEARCSSLLKILSFTLPFAGVHACIIGYYTGLKKAAVPAISQLVEQTARVLSLFVPVLADHGGKRNPGNPCACHVWYADLGDHRGSVYRNPGFCSTIRLLSKKHVRFPHAVSGKSLLFAALSPNRVCLSLLQSAESICIPLRLQLWPCKICSTFFLRNTDRNGSAACFFSFGSHKRPLCYAAAGCLRITGWKRPQSDRKTFCPHRPELPAAWHPLYHFLSGLWKSVRNPAF